MQEATETGREEGKKNVFPSKWKHFCLKSGSHFKRRSWVHVACTCIHLSFVLLYRANRKFASCNPSLSISEWAGCVQNRTRFAKHRSWQDPLNNAISFMTYAASTGTARPLLGRCECEMGGTCSTLVLRLRVKRKLGQNKAVSDKNELLNVPMVAAIHSSPTRPHAQVIVSLLR